MEWYGLDATDAMSGDFSDLIPDDHPAFGQQSASPTGAPPSDGTMADLIPADHPALAAAKSQPTDKMSMGDYLVSNLPFGKDVGAVGAAAGKATAQLLKGEKPTWDWSDERQTIADQQAQYEKEHPVASKVADVAGAAMAAPATEAEIPATMLGRMVSAGKSGAIMGGAYGASEGDTLSQRAENAGVGATLGEATGAAAVPALEKVAAPAVGWIGDKVSGAWRPFTNAGREANVGKILNDVTSAGGQTPTFETAPLPGMTPTTGQATNNQGLLWLERGLQGKNADAGALATEAKTNNNQAITSAIKSLGNTEDTGAGATMQQRLAASTDPYGARERVMGDLQNTLGVDGDQGFYDIKNNLDETRKAAAAPLYDAAYAEPAINPDEMEPSGSIGSLLSRPSMKAGMSNALKIAAEEGRDPNTMGITFNDAGDPMFSEVPSWQTLDYVKRGLDNVLEGYRDGVTGRLDLDTYGRAANQTRQTFIDALNENNPVYEQARNAWSGPSESMDAMTAGRNIFKPDSEITAQRIADMSDGNKQYFRAGVVRATQDIMNSTDNGLAAVKKVFGVPKMQQKIAAAFPPASFDAFMGRTAGEMAADPLVSKVLATDPLGNFQLAASKVPDQFIQPNAPEVLNKYLNAVGNDPEALDAARNAFSSKFLNTVQNAGLDQAGDPLVSQAKTQNFLKQYQHVVNSRLFTPEQRALIGNIGDATNMAARTAQGAPAGGGSDTAAKLASSKYIDSLIGPGASHIFGMVGGAAAGALEAGLPGAGIGAVAGKSAGTALSRALYAAPREKTIQILNQAMSDPDLAKALMKQASVGAEKTMPDKTKRYLAGVLLSPTIGSVVQKYGQTPSQ